MSMYLEYFSLTRHPFRITPDTSLFYSGGDDGRGQQADRSGDAGRDRGGRARFGVGAAT